MPAKTDSPRRSCPFSLYEDQIQYIERAGIGKNFSEKARSIIDRARGMYDNIVQYEGTSLVYKNPSAICAYTENNEGEKVWEKLPFEFNKKQGWKAIEKAAQAAGYISQTVYVEEEGFLAVWIDKAASAKNCATCKMKILEVLG